MSPTAELALVHGAVRRSRNIVFAVGLLSLVLGLGMIAMTLWAPDSTFGARNVGRLRTASAVVGGIFTLVGLGMGWYAGQLWNPERAPIARLIADRPADIRWIYVEQINANLAGQTVRKTQNVKIGDAAGKLHTLLTRNADVDGVLALLRTRAPHARFGYDKAAQKEFKSLRR